MDEKELVAMLETRFTEVLGCIAFERVSRHEWLRRWGWKTDQFRVRYRSHWGLQVNIDVFIPPERGWELDYVAVALTDLSGLYGMVSSTIRFPKFRWTESRFVARLMHGLQLGIEWLSDYDIPAKCLERLDTVNFNPSSPAMIYRRQYLSHLSQDIPTPRCLLNLEHEYPNEFSRAMFDVHHRGPLPKPPH